MLPGYVIHNVTDYLEYQYIYIHIYIVRLPHPWREYSQGQKFSKDISGEKTYSKIPTNTPRVLHVKTTRTRRSYVVSTSF